MPPRILLLAGKGIDATSFGATRYVLDQVYDLPYSVVDSEALDRMDLSTATAIVLPEGAAAGREAGGRCAQASS